MTEEQTNRGEREEEGDSPPLLPTQGVTPRRREECENQQTLRSPGQAPREKLDGKSRADQTGKKKPSLRATLGGHRDMAPSPTVFYHKGRLSDREAGVSRVGRKDEGKEGSVTGDSAGAVCRSGTGGGGAR